MGPTTSSDKRTRKALTALELMQHEITQGFGFSKKITAFQMPEISASDRRYIRYHSTRVFSQYEKESIETVLILG